MIGSYEPYIRAILHRVCAPVEAGGFGYRAIVVNYRGCTYILVHPPLIQSSITTGAGVPITSPQLYSAGTTDDFRQALMYISHRFPKATLHGLGFSLGSNVMTKYIAEEGGQTRLHSGCALACVSKTYHTFQTTSLVYFVMTLTTVQPWDLEKNNDV
jgi:predicted alpha/beta-fold hydrolase